MTRQPGHNRLGRILLPARPRDYLDNPALFGTSRAVTFITPPGGTPDGRRLAMLQHELVRQWRELETAQARLAGRWPFSQQIVSDTVLGKRWAIDLVGGALLDEIVQRRRIEEQKAAVEPGPTATRRDR